MSEQSDEILHPPSCACSPLRPAGPTSSPASSCSGSPPVWEPPEGWRRGRNRPDPCSGLRRPRCLSAGPGRGRWGCSGRSAPGWTALYAGTDDRGVGDDLLINLKCHLLRANCSEWQDKKTKQKTVPLVALTPRKKNHPSQRNISLLWMAP